MSISRYYQASRTTALTPTEICRAAHRRRASVGFPIPDKESPFLYEGSIEPDSIVAGSTAMPLGLDRVMPMLEQVLGSVPEWRRTLPGAEWQVHLDDFDLPWDESEGYFLPA
ncbi:hypothetical protein [Amycolatopsis orientalis]|uniref:hypothetical protein n=1 Tax=Amycolatopsis orientalis TaxID=31958 RepID=UPI0003A9E30D|nr:hypothetical protein [Amycolatopsis orientalis]